MRYNHHKSIWLQKVWSWPGQNKVEFVLWNTTYNTNKYILKNWMFHAFIFHKENCFTVVLICKKFSLGDWRTSVLYSCNHRVFERKQHRVTWSGVKGLGCSQCSQVTDFLTEEQSKPELACTAPAPSQTQVCVLRSAHITLAKHIHTPIYTVNSLI